MNIDLIIRDAEVLTMDPERPRAHTVGIHAGRIIALDEELEGIGATETINAAGATLLPGFIDAHTHLQFTGQGMAAVNIAAATDVEQALDIIHAAARTLPETAWVEVVGYDQRVFGRHLEAAEFDRAGEGRPVWARHISSHAAIVSSAVLDALPDQSVREDDLIGRGILVEHRQELVRSQRIPYPQAEIADFIERAALAARAEGITFCMEAGNGGFLSLSPVDLASYQQLIHEDRLPVRLQVMPSSDVFHPVRSSPSEPYRSGIDLGMRTGFGGDTLELGPKKIMLDGGMMVRAAHMSAPYVGDGDNAGGWQNDPVLLRSAIIDGHLGGWQLAVHAIGDRALDLALDAIAEAQRLLPRPDARHRIEHGGAIRPDQIPLLAELGVAVVTQPSFIWDSADDFATILGPEREPWLYRGRSLLDGGVRLIGSTDRPLPGTPLRAVQAFADRVNKTGRIIGDGEQISVQEGLELFTVHAAWVAGREHSLGRIRPGFLADLCLLAANPLTTPVTEIHNIAVLGTLLEGKISWVSQSTTTS